MDDGPEVGPYINEEENKIVEQLDKISFVKTPEGKKLLPICAIVKALRPHIKNSGEVIWKIAKITSEHSPPLTYCAKNENEQITQGIEPGDLLKALRFAIPTDELRVIMKSQLVFQALHSIVSD